MLDTEEEVVDQHMAKLAGFKKIIEEARAKSIIAAVSEIYSEADEVVLTETLNARMRKEIDAQFKK